MPICPNCNRTYPDKDNFCPNCGMPNSSSRTQEQTPPAQPDGVHNVYDPQEIQKNKGLCVLAYLGLLVFIPLLRGQNSAYTRFHTNQGLVLFCAEVAVSLVKQILTLAVGWIAFPLGAAINIVFGLISMLLAALMVLGICNVVGGRAAPLPLLGKIQLLR